MHPLKTAQRDIRHTGPVGKSEIQLRHFVAFTIPRGGVDTDGEAGEALIQELRNHVAKTLGPIAKPRQIMLVPELPKTRSGKIMRRLLRDVAENRSLGDVTTLQDSTVMDLISSGLQSGKSED